MQVECASMTYLGALHELRFRFENNEVPEHVVAVFFDLLKLPHKLIGAVELGLFTSRTPNLVASLEASDLLKKLVFATRVQTFDWEEIVVMIKHALLPSVDEGDAILRMPV